MNMRGTFRYVRNCTIPHFIPQGMVEDGFPVIVFPHERYDVTIGTRYDFEIRMTLDATYIIDGEVYRVAHAFDLRDVAGREGDYFDRIVHARVGQQSAKLGDNSQLQALMRSLQAVGA